MIAHWFHSYFPVTQMFISQRCNKNPFCSPHRIIENGCCLGSTASPLGRFLLPPLVEDLSDLDSQKLLLSDTLSIPVTKIDTKKKREKIVASSPDVVYFGGEDVRSEKTMGFRCRNGDLNNVLIESLFKWRKLVFFCIFFRICFHLFGENEGQRYAIQERFKRSTVNPYRWVLSSRPSKLQISQQLFGGEGCCSGWIFPGNSDQLRDCFFLDTRRLVNHQPHTSHFGKRCWIGQQC